MSSRFHDITFRSATEAKKGVGINWTSLEKYSTYLTYILYAVVSMTGFGFEIIYIIFTAKYCFKN